MKESDTGDRIMPTYLYSCTKHGEFEATHSITEQLTECPQCKEEGLPAEVPQRLISLSSFVLVGGGWAKDSYSSK
jgi:putative FmdB family regulatory protein